MNNKTIAGILNISVKTVETHRTGLMDRLGESMKFPVWFGLRSAWVLFSPNRSGKPPLQH